MNMLAPSGDLVDEQLSPWQAEILAECEQAILDLPEPGSIEPPGLDQDQPSLFDFYAELAVLRNEQRSGNRKLSGVLKDFSSLLTDLREEQSQNSEQKEQPESDPKTAKLLIDILDRIDRIIAASHAPLEEDGSALMKFFKHYGPTTSQWNRQGESLEILRKHFAPLMESTGLEYRPTEGLPYEPRTMKAVSCPTGCDLTELIVTKEILKGYWWQGENLRPAEVETGPK